METMNLSEAQPVRPSQGSWFAILAVSIAAFALVTSEFLPIGVLNDVANDLKISVGTAGLIITLPGVMAALAAPLLPVAFKQLDRRYVLLFLTAVMVIANAITAFASDFTLLLISRMMLGISIGGFWATAIALSGKLAPAHLPIAKATAVVMAGVTFATVLGVPIGTWLSEFYGWRSAFGITAIIGFVVFLLQLRYLPKLIPESSIRLHDLPALLRVPKARSGMLIVLLIGLAHFCAYSYLAPFFKNVAGFNGTTISSLLLLYGIAGIFGNAFAGYSGNFNIRYTLAFVGLCFAVVFFSFPVFAVHEAGAIVLTALWGFAFGAFPTSANIWMFVHAPQAVEKGMPLFVGLFQVMIATGSLLGGYIVDHFNENILIYGVLNFIILALISVFTLAKGLNNPKLTCES
ncbi:putative MFS family arabinose efflux permease [Acinetobacter baylyi]|uniref:MFS family arabinose efflux permease n=1 Tax=Acinetobacter baylyi TaxID=202950 RepID=A0ABU0UXY2_ACIBI|nr:MFS transporter [Acinetobacter baylyi]MDQ1209415.1 putative MFS family arabinose efflux permease [Acinetobacter baylyi]MDR6106991.1 putative MFS family arabinose efflux permease [Acinetobacter baylyi]MDR6186288.1 putative MFS family arabinose efflux permease [Acinetobacter baylyi]